MDDMRYYEVDVPTTTTVFVRGRGLTADQAMEHAARYAQSVVPSEAESAGYSSVAFADDVTGLAIVRADVEITGALTANDTTADQFDG